MEMDLLLQRLQLPVTEHEVPLLRQQLEACINALITTDFNRLVQLLYTVDVPEQKLKTALREQPEQDAAHLIADLILNRTAEKARSRQQFTNNAAPDDAERW